MRSYGAVPLVATMTEKRKPGRPSDQAKRGAIVEAASDLFFEHGFAATSIEQIAHLAGVSKVTIYNHFGDKRALFTAAVELKCDQMRGLFSIERVTKPAIADQLTAIGHAMNNFLSRPEMLQFDRRIAAETESNPAIGLAFLKAGPWRMRNDFSAFLAHADEHGQLRIANTDLAAEQFVALCKGIGDLERRFGKHLDQEENSKRIASAVDVFLKAYGTV